MFNYLSRKKFTTTGLKLIAILAMVCDHTTWAFIDVLSIEGQILHTIGRLTIPIMCFFIAEGYRKTSNLKRYIGRMVMFAVISIVPFYLFFGEEYGYRQNIIFDLLLALLSLVVIDSKKLNIYLKILLAGTIYVISATIGGWPLLPCFFVLAFYYGKSFKQKAFWITFLTCFVEGFVICMILLDNQFHFANFGWVWYQWIYFLGFVLALPLLKHYNGEKGSYPLGKYFFYCFYPIHFMVLYVLKNQYLLSSHTTYLSMNIFCLFCALAVVAKLLTARPSKALIISILLSSSAVIYIFGFILEILTGNPDFAFAGVIMEYFGEIFVFLFFLLFISHMCQKKIPIAIYMICILFSIVILTLLITTKDTGIFYSDLYVDVTGPFPRMKYSYGIGFYVFLFYVVLICGYSLLIGFASLSNFRGIDQKRIRLVIWGIFCPWISYLILLSGISNGYEMTALGILGSLFFIYRSIIHYGYFDSIQLAGENALHHFGDGVLVVDSMKKVVYSNMRMRELFPEIEYNPVISDNQTLVALLDGNMGNFIREGHMYDAYLTPLEEQGYIQGYMLSTKDMTDHYQHLQAAERFAHTDALTGLFNRSYFMECFEKYRKTGGLGTMLMFDLDNFKGVNDHYGHGIGDKVLLTLAETLKFNAHSRHLCCRIGGDEFCMFLKGVTEREEIAQICTSLIQDFAKKLADEALEGLTSISIGAAILSVPSADETDKTDKTNSSNEDEFTALYRNADQALYVAKNSGKCTFHIAKSTENFDEQNAPPQ